MEIIDMCTTPELAMRTLPYEMICLVCVFKRTECQQDLPPKWSNEGAGRGSEEQINIESTGEDENGKALLSDLTSIVELRNVHAENAKRDCPAIAYNRD